MKTNRCAIIAGSVIVGALLLKRFTTVLGAESFNADAPYISQQAQQAAQQHFSPPAGPPSAPPSQNPCDWRNLVAEKNKIDAWEKRQKDNLMAQIASTTTEANAERNGVDSQITQSKNDCDAKRKAEREAAAAKIKAEKEAAAAKAKADKLAKEKARQEAAEAKRQTDVATATGQIETASQQTGFFAAFTAWMASWGQDTTTEVPVVADKGTTAQIIPPVAQAPQREMMGHQRMDDSMRRNRF